MTEEVSSSVLIFIARNVGVASNVEGLHERWRA